jgi:hypothetical protein
MTNRILMQPDFSAEERTTDGRTAVRFPAPASDTAHNSIRAGRSSTKNVRPESFADLLDDVTYKKRRDGSVVYALNGRDVFTDEGRHIRMEPRASDDPEAVLAALLLAKEKYGGSIELTGSEEFKRRAIDVIVRHGVAVVLKDPEQHALWLRASKPPEDGIPKDVGAKPVSKRMRRFLFLLLAAVPAFFAVPAHATPCRSAEAALRGSQAGYEAERQAAEESAERERNASDIMDKCVSGMAAVVTAPQFPSLSDIFGDVRRKICLAAQEKIDVAMNGVNDAVGGAAENADVPADIIQVEQDGSASTGFWRDVWK